MAEKWKRPRVINSLVSPPLFNRNPKTVFCLCLHDPSHPLAIYVNNLLTWDDLTLLSLVGDAMWFLTNIYRSCSIFRNILTTTNPEIPTFWKTRVPLLAIVSKGELYIKRLEVPTSHYNRGTEVIHTSQLEIHWLASVGGEKNTWS